MSVPIDKAFFFRKVRDSLFRGRLNQNQVDGMECILRACFANGVTMPEQIAYVMATAYHETGTRMEPVREAFASSDQQAIDRLEAAWNAGRLRQVRTPYWRRDANGRSWFGRGYIQTTWEDNYRRAQRETGIPFHDNPDLMLQPEPSAIALVVGMRDGWYRRDRLGPHTLDRHINFRSVNFTTARDIVNGGRDRASQIADYAVRFMDAIRLTDSASSDNVRRVIVTGTGQSGLRIRTGPGTNHSIADVVPDGTRLRYVGRDGDWVRIEYADDNHFYVHSNYVKG